MTLLVDRTEKERIAEVLSLGMISLHYEEKLQQLIDMASHSFGISGIFITLVEDFKQIIKVKKGVLLNKQYNNDSMSYYMLQSKKPLIIQDIQADRAFRENCLLTAMPHFKFFACAPLISKSKHVIGILNICNEEKIEFTAADEEKLTIFSELATNLLETNQFVYQSKWQTKSNVLVEDRLIELKETRIRKLLELEAINEKDITRQIVNLSSPIPLQKNSYKQFINAAYIAANALSDKTELIEWSKILLEEENREISVINIPEFISALTTSLDICLTKNGNLLQWDTTPYSWFADETALRYICRSIICYVNKNTKDDIISIHSFDDQEYSIMVLRYNGTAITKKDLLNISALNPEESLWPESQQLFFTWHALKMLGGFMTAPDTNNGSNYVSFGLPKKNNSSYKAA